MSSRAISNDYKFTTLMDDSYYVRDSKSLLHYKTILNLLNEDKIKRINDYMPTVIYGGIDKAPIGVIQDPAGSAIGAGKPSGGGASGAIYSRFNLNPIPWIDEGECIFNSSTSNGKRILHTHSPTLNGSPHNNDDRVIAILELTNAYYNAIVLFNKKSNELGDDGKLLNLVPVSASIFAGRFLRRDLGNGHLDVSFTFLAIAIAISKLLDENIQIPKMNIYFYDKEVYESALIYMEK